MVCWICQFVNFWTGVDLWLFVLLLWIIATIQPILFLGGPKLQDGKNTWWTYCWWTKSCTAWYVSNIVNNGINYLSTGAGFCPSTVPIKNVQARRETKTDMKELLRERMFWILELACCFFLFIQKVRQQDMQISRVKTIFGVSFSKQHEGRWPTQAGGDMYATWWPLQQSGFGVRELEAYFRKKIKEGPGHFLIFQIGGVFGICLDKWLGDAQVLVVWGRFFLEEKRRVFWSHQSQRAHNEGSYARSYTRRNDRKLLSIFKQDWIRSNVFCML